MQIRQSIPFVCGSAEAGTPGPQAPGRAFLIVTVVLLVGSQDAETSRMPSVVRSSLPFLPQFDFRIQTFILKSLSLLLNAICLNVFMFSPNFDIGLNPNKGLLLGYFVGSFY